MDTEEFTDISIRYENKVARICINRPDKLNAIRIRTYREIIAAMQAADASPDCNLIVLEGANSQFTAGNDLSDLIGTKQQQVMDCVQQIFHTVAQLEKVLVAVVEGVAVGIGTTILLHCDVVIASSKAKFRVPFANLGVSPEGASSTLLPRAIGQKMAREVLLTGRFFSAEEALSWGLVTKVADPGKAAEVAEEYISAILKQPLPSLLVTKKLLRASLPDIETVIHEELKAFKELLQTDETKGRIHALLK